MKKLLIAITFLVSTSASAGILLEPYLGYNAMKTTQPGNPSGDATGVGYGLRVGWTLPLIFIGVDYSLHDLDYDQDGSTSKEAIDVTNLGAVVGANLPIIRAWAGYNFSSEWKQDNGKFKGSGMKAGVGFKMPVIPLSFNLEYIINEYNKANGHSLTNKPESKSVFLSVSAPLTF